MDGGIFMVIVIEIKPVTRKSAGRKAMSQINYVYLPDSRGRGT